MSTQRKTMFSFEIFPPKNESSVGGIYETLDALGGLEPDFISVTCGAGGSIGKGNLTIEIASAIQNKYHRAAVAHMPCINFSKEEVLAALDALEEAGVSRILALRGDRAEGVALKNDFHYAADLIRFIKKERGDKFQIYAACYPEGHLEAVSLEADLRYLKEKVDAGADHLLTQLFFDNQYFYDFLEKARRLGIDVPIEAGIMPVTNKKQIERMVTLCGATLPRKFQRMLARFESSPEAVRAAGLAFAVDQIVDLIVGGVDGIHLYTMNSPAIARHIAGIIEPML